MFFNEKKARRIERRTKFTQMYCCQTVGRNPVAILLLILFRPARPATNLRFADGRFHCNVQYQADKKGVPKIRKICERHSYTTTDMEEEK